PRARFFPSRDPVAKANPWKRLQPSRLEPSQPVDAARPRHSKAEIPWLPMRLHSLLPIPAGDSGPRVENSEQDHGATKHLEEGKQWLEWMPLSPSAADR